MTKGTSCLLQLIILPFNILARAFAVRALWSWFAVPLGIPAIGLAHAAGITVFVGMLTMQLTQDGLEDEDHAGLIRQAGGFLITLCCLAFGYLYHLAMLGGF